jgi:invasion protein IalB
MRCPSRTIAVLAGAIAVLAASSAKQSVAEQSKQQKTAAAAAPAQPTLLGQYGDWGAYTATPEGKQVCFTLAKPKSSNTTPAGRKRDAAYVFISTRPAENVRNEISAIVGYPFRQSSDATAEVGPTKFAMYTQNDGAWIKNVAEEQRLIDAMRKGADLTIKGTSSRGTNSTDVYSLKGLSQAMDRVAQECK